MTTPKPTAALFSPPPAPATTPATAPADAFRFRSAGQGAFEITQATGGTNPAARQFKGVAYSGEVIPNHFYWGDVIFDLDSLSVPAKFAALIDHNPGQRAGYVNASSIGTDGLTVQGQLLTSADGQRVADDSDAGFPWQMSVHIEPGMVEEIPKGQAVVVNGKNLTGPISIFRNSRIREVSFCAVGYDGATHATAFSKPSDSTPHNPTDLSPGDPTMTQELTDELSGRIAELETQAAANAELLASAIVERDAALTQFNAARQASRTGELTSVFSKLGMATDATALAPFIGMEQAAYTAALGTFSTAATKLQKLPTHLFSHQAGTGEPGQGATANPFEKALAAHNAKFAKA